MSLDALNAERDLLCGRKTRSVGELASIERVTTKLDELALSIEFELHLKRTPPAALQSHEGVQLEVKELFEPTKKQADSTTHSTTPLAISEKPSAFEARLEAWFGPLPEERE
jgi:hypothetical protein